ncbi:MAG: hypothetical protein JSS30_01960 [Verrucomicrobia bacterium]|nr:hypothetical protein [Verrucomicrobiota bacterium]
MSICKIQCHQAISDFIQPRLEKVKQDIRLIDPSLLGERRYEENAHYLVVKKIIDLIHSIKRLLSPSKVKKLTETKEIFEKNLSDLDTIKARIREIDPGLIGEESTSRLPAFQRLYYRSELNALGTELEKQLAKLQAATVSYEELPFSDEDKAQVKKLIQMVANDSIPSLISKLGELMAAKKKLYGIHPLKSFEFMLNEPDVSKNLARLSKTPERWVGVPIFAPNKGFRPQSAEKFRRYDTQGLIQPYFPEFVKNLGLSSAQAKIVSTLAQEEKWDEMIAVLVELKCF